MNSSHMKRKPISYYYFFETNQSVLDPDPTPWTEKKKFSHRIISEGHHDIYNPFLSLNRNNGKDGKKIRSIRLRKGILEEKKGCEMETT